MSTSVSPFVGLRRACHLSYSLPTSQIQDDFVLITGLVKESPDHLVDSMHAHPVSTYTIRLGAMS